MITQKETCPHCNHQFIVCNNVPVVLKCRCGTEYPFNGGLEKQAAYEVQRKIELVNQGRAAWTALHTMQQPTPDKIVAWLDTVPSYSCKCREFAVKYIKDNPPPYDDQATFFEWTWRFHDTVDQKTGDQRMTLEEAREFWAQTSVL